MAHILTKRGQRDNIVTYEHTCDTKADMELIEPQYATLGSTAMVLKDESKGNTFEVYMATSDHEWIPLLNGGGGSGENLEQTTKTIRYDQLTFTNHEDIVFTPPEGTAWNKIIIKETTSD